jgi:uncharacterized membrane protein YhfC
MDVVIRLLNSLLMFAVPLVLATLLVRRFRLEWRIFLIGAGTFAGAQILEIPFNRFLLQPLLERFGLLGADQGWPLLSMAIIFGLVAGVFEELARYVVYRRWLNDERRWEGGLFFGLGHGAMEAMLLGGLSFYVILQTIAYRNADLTIIVPPEQLEIARAQLDAYWSAPWYVALLGALERVFAIGIQISLAVIVLQVFIRRSHVWLAMAIGWHLIVDAVAVFGASTWGIYITELIIGLMAAVSLVFLYLLRSRERRTESLPAESEAGVDERRRKIIEPKDDPPLDRLDDSRYDSG